MAPAARRARLLPQPLRLLPLCLLAPLLGAALAARRVGDTAPAAAWARGAGGAFEGQGANCTREEWVCLRVHKLWSPCDQVCYKVGQQMRRRGCAVAADWQLWRQQRRLQAACAPAHAPCGPGGALVARSGRCEALAALHARCGRRRVRFHPFGGVQCGPAPRAAPSRPQQPRAPGRCVFPHLLSASVSKSPEVQYSVKVYAKNPSCVKDDRGRCVKTLPPQTPAPLNYDYDYYSDAARASPRS